MKSDQLLEARAEMISHWRQVAEAAAKESDWATCQQACESLLKLDPRHHFGLETLATVLLQKSETEKALETVERLLNVSPRDPLHRLRYATILQMRGENGRALQQFERIAQMYPDAPFTQDARDAVEMLDKMQTSQILLMAAENPEFRWELERSPQGALDRAGFVLSENGFENLRHIIPGGTDEIEHKAPKIH